MTLNELKPGDVIHVTKVCGEGPLITRLRAMGCNPGSRITVLSRNRATLIVRVFDVCMAIDAETAKHIEVDSWKIVGSHSKK